MVDGAAYVSAYCMGFLMAERWVFGWWNLWVSAVHICW